MTYQLSANKEITIKIINLIVSVLGVIGVITSIYFGLKSKTNAINNQWWQEFYKQKMNVYLRASEVASKIAYLKLNNIESTELSERILEFNTLYGGPMAIMEETEVEAAMVIYRKALKKDLSPEKLIDLALYLSHVLRNESRSTFLDEEANSHYGSNDKIIATMKNILND